MSSPVRSGTPSVERLRKARHMASRFAPLVAPHRKTLAGAAACMLGGLVLSLLAPWPAAIVIDCVLLDKPMKSAPLESIRSLLPADRGTLLIVCCLAVVAIASLKGLFTYGEKLLTATAGHRVVSDLRLAVFTRLQRLSLRFHGQKSTGDLLVRLTGDVSLLRELLVPAVIDGASEILLLGGTLCFLLLLDPGLTLVALGMIPLLAIATARSGSRLREVSREQRRKEGRIATTAGEALASVVVVQAYSREEQVTERFSRQSAKSLTAGLRSLRIEESLARKMELTLAAGSALVLWFGTRRALSGGLTPGELIVFLAYVRSVSKPVQSLVRLASRVSKAIASGERVLEILDSVEMVPQDAGAPDAPPLAGRIEFENVSFSYEPGRTVLDRVSFKVEPGERVGVVGPSGSGKSTLLALLMRLYEPDSGRILVDGIDIRRWQLESYRRQIAVVLQEPFLFGIAVEENIRFGRLDATPEEVREAARAAGAEEFVDALPEGFDSILGERGGTLSRGQQQRVALARAVLRRAPLLVFDEPTTGLDARSEQGVLQALAQAAAGHTCLWIAHDRSQILDCPRIIVLRDGRLVADGDPALLIDRAGALAGLYGAA